MCHHYEQRAAHWDRLEESEAEDETGPAEEIDTPEMAEPEIETPEMETPEIADD